jgi:hypothetical protein
VPLTIIVNAGPPAIAEFGVKLEIVTVVDAPVMVKLNEKNAAPLYVTVTLQVPSMEAGAEPAISKAASIKQ